MLPLLAATLAWHLPPLNVPFGWFTTGLLHWNVLPPLKFTLEWLIKGLLPWRGR